MKILKETIWPLIISIFLYLLFFYPLISHENSLYSGKDSIRLHYASRFYLNDSLNQGIYPFWTERIFGGYPIYSDLERGYQNIVNIITVYLLGPINSYKILHLFCYLLGSMSLYFIIKRHSGNLLTFVPSNLVYFFSFFTLIHQQHFNFTLTIYLLPCLLLTTIKLFEDQKLKFLILNTFLIYFLITLGAFQIILISFIATLIYLYCFLKEKNNLLRIITIQFVAILLIAQPSITSFYNLYKESDRKETFAGQGNLDQNNYINLIYPFGFGIDNYNGEQLNPNYVKNENSLYLGISSILVFLVLVFSKNYQIKKYLAISLAIFLILNLSFIPIINIFRYWVRAELILLLTTSISISFLLSNLEKTEYNKLFWIPVIFLLIPIYFNENGYFLLKLSINENIFIPVVWIIIAIITIAIFYLNIKYKNLILAILISFDLLFFNYFLDKNLFLNIKNINYEKINNLSVYETYKEDELALFKNNFSSSGYGGLTPKIKLNYERELDKFNFFKQNALINFLIILTFFVYLKHKKVLR